MYIAASKVIILKVSCASSVRPRILFQYHAYTCVHVSNISKVLRLLNCPTVDVIRDLHSNTIYGSMINVALHKDTVCMRHSDTVLDLHTHLVIISRSVMRI